MWTNSYREYRPLREFLRYKIDWRRSDIGTSSKGEPTICRRQRKKPGVTDSTSKRSYSIIQGGTSWLLVIWWHFRWRFYLCRLANISIAVLDVWKKRSYLIQGHRPCEELGENSTQAGFYKGQSATFQASRQWIDKKKNEETKRDAKIAFALVNLRETYKTSPQLNKGFHARKSVGS